MDSGEGVLGSVLSDLEVEVSGRGLVGADCACEPCLGDCVG